jgi:tetratricopeptide (TPR) repeat protein
VELKGLEKAEALHLLLTRADIPKPWDVSTKKAGEAITRTLGYLALALIHAGTCIYRRVCSLGDYLNLHSASRSKLQQRRKSVSNTAEPGSQDDLVHAVYSSFDVSGNFLFNKQTMRSQDASEILNIICFYHFESIPVEIFTRAVANRRRATDKSTLGSFGPRLRAAFEQRLEPPRVLPGFLKGSGDRLDKYRVTWAISELQSLSLISYDSGEGSFTMHPLVQEWARYSLSSSEKALWTSISFNTLMESISLPSESNNESESDFHRDMLPHLDACLQEHGNPLSISIVGLENYQLTLSKICRPTFAMILRDQIRNTAKCGYVLAERGQFKEAVVYLEAVKNNLVKLLGFNHENTMSAMLGMAGVCWGLGRLEEAIALQQQVVDARTKVYGPLDQRTLQAMNQLGRSHWLYGQYQEALTLQELTAERMRVVLGPDHSETLGALDNLGVTLSAWHRFEESMRIHKQVLQVREKTLGDTHPQTLETRSNLAMALKDLGNLQEAKAAMHVVHEQRREQLGKEHPWTLWALCYLAKIHTEMGLLQEAEDMLTWGCEAGERSLSKDHLGVLMGRGELSRIYSRQGRLDEADKLCTETVQLIAESRGVAHPDCVYGTFKLGQLQELRNDKQRAVSLYQLALERAEMRITRAHPLAKKIERLLLTLQNSLSSSEPDLLAAVGSTKSDEQVFRHRGIRSQKTW